MRLTLTRHGQTHENVAGISMGQSIEGELNENGILQAQKAAERLKNEVFDYVYVSDLKRAVDTAKEILIFHPNTQLITTSVLRERSSGIYEGGKSAVWKKLRQESILSFNEFRPEGGESYKDVQKRVGDFYSTLLRKHADDSILIVSHTGALTILYLTILKKQIIPEEYKAHKPGNTAITMGEFFPNQEPALQIFNDMRHLN